MIAHREDLLLIKMFRIGKCNHYMYRGEAVFFARFDGRESNRLTILWGVSL